jgi:pimeloyl-ACP methyl ester carboxylesterase
LSGGQKIVYCDYGPKTGRPLIVFHSGYGCRLSIPLDYEEICQRHNRRVIIPDRPGVGKTPFIDGHPQGWNKRLQEFIDVLEIDTYDVLGCILGCQLAVSFAANADARLQKVILCSPVVINHRSTTKYLTGILNPSARLVRASKRFAREIYELWLKSITLNLGTHYRSMVESSIGRKELELFKQNGTLELLIDTFKEGVSHSLAGISHEMVYCISPLKLAREKLKFPIEVWFGDEDKRISLEGVKAILEDFENHTLHIKEGYSEHIYYALFEEIIA